MHDLFDWIVREGEAAIRQMCEERRQESLTLEFKTKERLDIGGLTKSDKKNLGAALSGFSNSVGGLLIWGVDARQGEEGIDCAQNLVPIPSINKFASDVSGLATDYLRPPNEAIRVEDIPSDRLEGGGYLVMLVEPSELRPHMSMAPDHHRYYRRSGDRFSVMEHYEIQDMFNQIAPVRLNVFWQFGGIHHPRKEAIINFGIRNTTRLTGKFPYLHLKDLAGGRLDTDGPYGAGRYGLKPAPTQGGNLFAGDANDVLHPGREIVVFGIDVPFQVEQNRQVYADPGQLQALSFTLEVGCENSEMREERIELSPHELYDLINPHI